MNALPGQSNDTYDKNPFFFIKRKKINMNIPFRLSQMITIIKIKNMFSSTSFAHSSFWWCKCVFTFQRVMKFFSRFSVRWTPFSRLWYRKMLNGVREKLISSRSFSSLWDVIDFKRQSYFFLTGIDFLRCKSHEGPVRLMFLEPLACC